MLRCLSRLHETHQTCIYIMKFVTRKRCSLRYTYLIYVTHTHIYIYKTLRSYGIKSPMTRHFRTLCQSFVLSPATKVAVPPSLEQPPTIFTYVIKSRNAVMSKITGLNCWLDSNLKVHFTTLVPV